MGERKRKKCLKLTREQKKLVWQPPKENAGAGWQSRWEKKQDPRFHPPLYEGEE